MKTARNLIAAAAELTARVKNGKYHAYGRYTLLRVNTDRYSAAVIGNPYNSVIKNFNQNLVTVACQRLINRVIHYFINKVVQTPLACRTDIHTGSFSYGFKSL